MIAPATQSPVAAVPAPYEQVLMQAVADGDTKAFDRLVSPHRQFLLKYAWGRLDDRDAAEDAVQTAMLSVFKQVRARKKIAHIRPYLTVAVRFACDSRRHDLVDGRTNRVYRRALRMEEVDRERMHELRTIEIESSPTANDRKQRDTLRETLAKARRHLPMRDQGVFFRWLQHVAARKGRYDAAPTAVARTLDRSAASVADSIDRSRAKLQRLCGRGEGAHPHPLYSEIEQWGKKRGMSVSAAGAVLGIPSPALSYWKQGRSRPPDPDAIRSKMAELDSSGWTLMKLCQCCGEEFQAVRSRTRFCSKPCAQIIARNKMKKYSAEA